MVRNVKKKTEQGKKAGRVDLGELRKGLNKKAGKTVAHDLTQSDPSTVRGFIPTGSALLDRILMKGRLAGWSVGRISSLEGTPGSGKSFLAGLAAANAQKMGIVPVYFDSEASIDPDFLRRLGCNLEDMLYLQTDTVETTLETIEQLIQKAEESGQRFLYIWDSLAASPCQNDVDTDYDPTRGIAVKARILSKGLSKLMIPLQRTQGTLLVLNQLRKNISSDRIDVMINPWLAPGGNALIHSYSTRIWLTPRQSKKSFVYDDMGRKIGIEIKALLKKSRGGTEGRSSNFQITFSGEKVGVMDEGSWLEVVTKSDDVENRGAWYHLKYKDDTTEAFQKSSWLEKLQDEKFKARVEEILDDMLINKFDKMNQDLADTDYLGEDAPERPKVSEEKED